MTRRDARSGSENAMPRILIATASITGHVLPGLSIARELVARGHDVFWYTAKKFEERIASTGARYLPMHVNRDWDDADINGAFPGRAERKGIAQLKFDMMHVFIDPIPAQVADLESLHAEHRFDVAVHDLGFLGMGLFAERTGIPYATYGMTALTFPSRDTAPFGLAMAPSQTRLGRLRNRMLNVFVQQGLFRRENSHYQAMRRLVGLGRSRSNWFLRDAASPDVFLQASVPGFDYPRSDLPPEVEFIGPFLPDRQTPFASPLWWHELGDEARPVVHVTQGTIATEATDLLRPTLDALRDLDVLVVATTGGKPVESLGPLPSNVRAAPFVPHVHLLPKVDAMVTNAGFGGVQTALAHGVPLVAAGGSEEKPEIARRIAWTGAGVDLRTSTPTPAAIRAAVREVLSVPSYREHARRLQREIAGYDASTRAANAVERLIPRRARAERLPRDAA